jgi:valyl-tRNA synthetase
MASLACSFFTTLRSGSISNQNKQHYLSFSLSLSLSLSLLAYYFCHLHDLFNIIYETLLDIVHAVRSERKQLNLQKEPFRLHVWTSDELCEYIIHRERTLLECFCKLSGVEIHRVTTESLLSSTLPTLLHQSSIVRTIHPQCKILIPIEEELRRVNVTEELARLAKLKTQLEARISSLQQQMEASDYHTKVPPHVQEKNRQKYDLLQNELTQLCSNIEKLCLLNKESNKTQAPS